MKTLVIYTLSRGTSGADYFYDVETLWKSFVHSYSKVNGECTREDLYTFIDPNGNKYTVIFSHLFDEVIHL